MNKEEFKEIMTWFIDKIKRGEILSNAFNRYNAESFWYSIDSEYETKFLEVLKIAVNDQYDWITYWVYDLECGKKYTKGCVQSKEGIHIPLKTIGNLYDIITNNE